MGALLTWLGSLLGGPFARAAVDAYRAKLDSGNTQERIAADLATKELEVERREAELRTQLNLADNEHFLQRMIRPLFALPFVIYVWKVVVWDKVLAWGATDAIGGSVLEWAGWVLSFYFIGRSVEKVARIIRR